MAGPNPVDVPFARGLNASLRFFLDQGSGAAEVILRFKTWKLVQNVTEVTDDVGGEDASRLDTVHNYWELSGDPFYRDGSVLTAKLNDYLNNLAGAAPLAKAASIKILARDGSKFAGTFSQVDWGAFGLSMGARADALMQDWKIRARYFKQGQSS